MLSAINEGINKLRMMQFSDVVFFFYKILKI